MLFHEDSDQPVKHQFVKGRVQPKSRCCLRKGSLRMLPFGQKDDPQILVGWEMLLVFWSSSHSTCPSYLKIGNPSGLWYGETEGPEMRMSLPSVPNQWWIMVSSWPPATRLTVSLSEVANPQPLFPSAPLTSSVDQLLSLVHSFGSCSLSGLKSISSSMKGFMHNSPLTH